MLRSGLLGCANPCKFFKGFAYKKFAILYSRKWLPMAAARGLVETKYTVNVTKRKTYNLTLTLTVALA